MSFVYFIQEGRHGNIKIGFSSEPERRLRALQTGNPKKLRLLLCLPGDRTLEQSLHRRFHKANKTGEWFEPISDLLRFIAIQRNTLDTDLRRLDYGLCVYAETENSFHLVFKDNESENDDGYDTVYLQPPINLPIPASNDVPYRRLFSVDEMHPEELLMCSSDLIQWIFDPRRDLPRERTDDIGVRSGYLGPAIWYEDGWIPTLCIVAECIGETATIFEGDGTRTVNSSELRHLGDEPRQDGPVNTQVSVLQQLHEFTDILIAKRAPTEAMCFMDNISQVVVATARVHLGMRTRRGAAIEMWGWDTVKRLERKLKVSL